MKSLRWQGAPGSNNDALSHAVAMVMEIVLFGVLGAWIDSRAGTRPLFLLVGGVLGVLGAFASAYYRYERRMADHDAGKPWTRRAGSTVAAATIARSTPSRAVSTRQGSTRILSIKRAGRA